MKSLKKVAVLLAALFIGSSAFASDFDWSQCWCNYGAGIEEGDVIVDVGVGYDLGLVALSVYTDSWFVPPVEASFELPKKIWKLPFTFGGAVYYEGAGYTDNIIPSKGKHSYFANDIAVLGLAKYHVMLPPKNLDVYAGLKVGLRTSLVQDYYEGESATVVPKFHFFHGEVMGATWYFNENVGVNVELGYPIVTRVGFSFKF